MIIQDVNTGEFVAVNPLAFDSKIPLVELTINGKSVMVKRQDLITAANGIVDRPVIDLRVTR